MGGGATTGGGGAPGGGLGGATPGLAGMPGGCPERVAPWGRLSPAAAAAPVPVVFCLAAVAGCDR